MSRIYPEVRECDVIVLASPLYYWNIYDGKISERFLPVKMVK